VGKSKVRMVEDGSQEPTPEARSQKLEKLKIESGRLKMEKELGCCGQFLL